MFRSSTSPPLILLVDDDPYQAEIASYIAYELGCEFESALSGREAIEKMSQRTPDVILLDVRMPDISGYELCRRIKTTPETAGTQVLFVTARTEEEDLLQGFEALANDYLTKPFSARELKARVKNALRTKALVDALTTRTQILELQQEITEKLEDPLDAEDESRMKALVPILDRVATIFASEGATAHIRRAGGAETRAVLSTTWAAGMPPTYLAALALAEDPRVERAPRMPGESRDSANDWTVFAAPLWVGEELIGTLRVHRRGPLPSPGESTELEHLVALSDYMARTLNRAAIMEERRSNVRADS
jgi:CheY-like chemotaxis protein